MNADNRERAQIFKAFCDENRLAILELLRGGEKCACVLLESLSIAQSTLSHHMRILCESGVVLCRIQGKWSHYSLSPKGCAQAREILGEITTPVCIESASGVCECL
jgi:ArsR family transcriptional regulator